MITPLELYQKIYKKSIDAANLGREFFKSGDTEKEIDKMIIEYAEKKISGDYVIDISNLTDLEKFICKIEKEHYCVFVEGLFEAYEVHWVIRINERKHPFVVSINSKPTQRSVFSQ